MSFKKFCAVAIIPLFIFSVPLSAQQTRSTSGGVVLRDTIQIQPRAQVFSTLITPVIGGGYNASYHITTTEIQDAHVTKVVLHTAQLDTTPVLYGGVGTNNISLGRVEGPGEITIQAYTFENVAMTVVIGEGDPYTYYVSFSGKPGGRILLSPRVSMPTVRINTPRDEIFTLSKDYQPTIVPTISYTPKTGAFVPEVTVSPSQINTSEYYEQLKTTEYIEIPITATAANERGTATDTTSIFLTRSNPLANFQVAVTPKELKPGDTAAVTAVAIDEEGTEFNYPEDEWVLLALDVGEDEITGTFVSPTQGAGDYFLYAPYGELKRGEVQFISGSGNITAFDTLAAVGVYVYGVWNPGSGMDTVTIHLAGLDHFDVTVSPGITEHNQRVRMRAEAKDKQGNLLRLSGESPLSVVAAPSGFGRLEAVWDSRIVPTRLNEDSLIRARTVQLLQSKEKVNAFQRAYLQSLLKDTVAFRQKFNSNKSVSSSLKGAARNHSQRAGSAAVENEKSNSKGLKVNEEEPEPSEYLTGYGALYFGSLYYVADGTEPVHDTTITFTVASTEKPSATGTGSLVIGPPSCPAVEFSKNPIGPGDTAEVRVKRKFADGTTVDYPAGTQFLVTKLWESVNDMVVLLGSEDGNNVISSEPARFVANANIEADSVIIMVSGAPVDWQNENECPDPTVSLVITKEEEISCSVVSLSPSSLTTGDTAEVIIKGKIEDANGEHLVDYPPGQLFNVRITEGQTYGELLEVNTGRKSDTLTGAALPVRFIAANAIDADSVVFTIHAAPVVATQAMTTTVNKKGEKVTSAKMVYREIVLVECASRDVIGTIIGLDHFKVWLEQDTVAYTESAKLFVQAKNKDSNDVFLSDDATIRLHIGRGSEYGTFIKPDNDTIWNAIPLFTLPYSEVKAGKVKFAAVKKNPASIEQVSVNADLLGTIRKSGTKEIPVAEQTLRIVMEGEREVVPRNLRGLQNPPNPTEENKKRFTVQLTRNKAGVANHPFRVTTNYVDGMGGHDHITPRRQENNSAQTRINYGYFILRRINNNTEHDRPYNSQTQEDGRENFDYVSSEFGDSMRIIVKSTDPIKQKFLKDSTTIAEKVDELVRLDDEANYDLIGGTAQHHGPTTYTDNHNHYSIADVRTNIQNIAAAYHQQFRDEGVLQINDMSLPFGGGFDVNGNWERDIVPGGAHQTHRDGRSVDLRIDRGFGGIPVLRDENGRLVRDRDGNLRGNPDFNIICETYHFTPRIHSPDTNNEHYHLDYNN